MNPVDAFFSIVVHQRQRLLEIVEYDQDCQWANAWQQRIGRVVNDSRRRGWTQRDKIRAAYSEQSKLALPSIQRPTTPMPRHPKRIRGRIDLLFSLFDQYAPSETTATSALDFCESRPTIGRAVGSAVIELHAVHRRWLDYMSDDSGYPIEIETKWESARDRLHGMLEVLSDTDTIDPPSIDPPISLSALYELCVNRPNRVGNIVASSDSTVRGWKKAKGFPKDNMTWTAVRNWLNTKKDYDIGDPPTEC